MSDYQPVSLELPTSSTSYADEIGVEEDDSVVDTQLRDAYMDAKRRGIMLRLSGSFWMTGMMNNVGYVVMIAAAKSISEGGVGLVFLVNILPAFIIRATAPYWFESVSYDHRLLACTVCMVASFSLVASFSSSLSWQLLGVSFASAQVGLGEASLLALAGKVDGAAAFLDPGLNENDTRNPSVSKKDQKGICLTAFSSGTGFSGVFGFFWKWFWNDWLGFSLQTTLWLAMTLAAIYRSLHRYIFFLQREQESLNIALRMAQIQAEEDQTISTDPGYRDQIGNDVDHGHSSLSTSTVKDSKANLIEAGNGELNSYGVQQICDEDRKLANEDDHGDNDVSNDFFDEPSTMSKITSMTETLAVNGTSKMTFRQRFFLVLQLWPFMVPLFTVYAAEYTLQSGTWSAIGFPVSDQESRDKFFQYSNWLYQAGVFCSRSSGAFFVAPMPLLWAMPFFQVANVLLYWKVAANQGDPIASTTASLVHSPYFLYPTAFYTGLLGGAVYVHGYLRICRDVPLDLREFALSASSLADTLGIVVADILGLVVQACLYKINGLEGAMMTCPNRN